MPTEAPVRALPRPVRPAVLSAVVLVVGLGGGVLTEDLQGRLDPPWAAWMNSVAVWCAVAFAIGALSGGARVAAAAGVGSQLLLVTGYYAAQVAGGLPLSATTVAGWLVAGVVSGVVFGVAGRWWRTAEPLRSAAGLALLSGAFVAEGWMRAVRFPWQGASGVIMIAAGLLVALALGRSRRQRLVAVGLLVVVVPAGWAGTELVNLLFAAF